MKHVGIDYGTKRIGVAVSDGDGRIAFPREVITSDSSAVEKLVALISDEDVGKIVVGESTDLSGKENAVMARIKEFKDQLEKVVGVPVVYETEFYTTVEATRIQGRNEKTDASAAALILQHFLDRHQA